MELNAQQQIAVSVALRILVSIHRDAGEISREEMESFTRALVETGLTGDKLPLEQKAVAVLRDAICRRGYFAAPRRATRASAKAP